MTRRRKPPLYDVDPVEVLFRAMRVCESLAAREQQRGADANLRVMADAMRDAASLAKDIAAIQDRRGTAPQEPIPAVDIEIIGTCIHCNQKFPVSELAPAPERERQPRTIDAEVVKEPPATTAKPAKPKALDYHPAQDFGKGAPIKPHGGFLGIVYDAGPNAITSFKAD